MADKVIRQLTIADLSLCEDNFPQPESVSFRQQILRQSANGYALFGLFQDDDLAGLIHINRHGPLDPDLAKLLPHPVIGNLFVKPNYRGQGIAKALLAHCQDVVRSEGYTKVGLIVSTANQTARHLYASLDYKPLRQLPPRLDRDDADRLYYHKDL